MDHVELVDARIVLVRLAVGLLDSVRASFFSGMNSIAANEATLIGNYVFLGQYDGKPYTVSDLARLTGLSRQSVTRRLDELIAKRYIERQSRHYFVGPALTRLPNGQQEKIKQRIAMVQRAAKELSKLGE